MSDTSTAIAERPSAVYTGGDERLAYRGIFQRLFIRPEIGALIGVVGLWVFFWAVSVPFGTAGGTGTLIDYASSPLGIMAVAVSMLMVGGEFDLSAGAMTGAMGIVVILFSKEVGERGGAGLNLWIAIPLSLIVALAIGYWNGLLVERTKLPSFTITLGTYYILIGAKLGFSKLIVDQVQVGDIRDAGGHPFWQKVFAAGWNRNTHIWESRDKVYVVGLMLAIALLVVAIVEMQFKRRHSGYNAAGYGIFAAGAVVAVVGIILLHQTDDIGGNVLGSAVIAIGTLVGLVGYGLARFERAGERGSFAMPASVLKWLGIAAGAFAIAIIIATVMKSSYPIEGGIEDDLFFPFTKQGFRATVFLVFVGVGLVGLFIAGSHARRTGPITRATVLAVSMAIVLVLAFFIRSESTSVKFRTEAFSCLLGVGLFLLAWIVLGLMFAERTTADPASDRLGARLLVVAALAAAVGVVVRLLWITQAELDAGTPPANFSVRTIWFVVFTAAAVFVLGKTRFGSWTFAVGGNKEAARQVGVPAARTKTQLFMLVAGAAWLCGMLLAFRLNTIQANTGNGEEFDYIIAAVVGGTLLTGGYGTALGGALGAMIVAMAVQGIPSSRWNSDWRFLFLGVILLLAMLANRSIRTKAEGMRR